jgi:hypothetical protein
MTFAPDWHVRRPRIGHSVARDRVVRGPNDDPEVSDEELLAQRRSWFEGYTRLCNVVAHTAHGPYTCPCCGHLTLAERGGYDICTACGWEDDGQDDHDSALVRGGPNGRLSLDDGRAMYVSRGGLHEPHIPPTEATYRDGASGGESHSVLPLFAMAMDLDQLIRELEGGHPYLFRDWPATHFAMGPSGVYTIWRGPEFLYVGMSYMQRDDDENPNAKGVFGRLASHASGRRSGDQFCVYVCDRFVVPQLSPDDLEALAIGKRLLDTRTREFIAEHLCYRVAVTESGADARALEARIRREGLPDAGRPLINP